MRKKDENMFGWNATIRKLTEETPAHLPRHEAPPTVKDVLLKRWENETREIASLMIGYDGTSDMFYTSDICGNIIDRYRYVDDALSAQIAYLNSAAEVGK